MAGRLTSGTSAVQRLATRHAGLSCRACDPQVRVLQCLRRRRRSHCYPGSGEMDEIVYRLLALCARAECRADHYHLIGRAAAELTEWDDVLAQARNHGMAPLLYVHLRDAGVQLPLAVRRELQGRYLRHRHANQVRTRVLREILQLYERAGIPVLVLKGGALMHLVYQEPGLRPMSDLDILVRGSDLWRARDLLTELGFNAPPAQRSALPHRHLGMAVLRTDHLDVHVEIHHQLFSDYFDHAISFLSTVRGPAARCISRGQDVRKRLLHRTRRPDGSVGDSRWLGMDGVTAPPRPFALAGQTAYTLGDEDMLWHLCQHLTSHVNVWDYCRLVWVADIVSLAERFVHQIDWRRVRRRYPAVLDTLSLFHFMTPLADELLALAAVEVGHAPTGIGVEYQGWPKARTARSGAAGSRRVLLDTFFPSEWWLRLRYKLGSARRVGWYRWVRHPIYILGHLVRALLERMGWPTPLELAKGARN
jgi:hypothetical protein